VTGPIQVVDSLSLLSLKVASNVFDLSSGMHHVSIRDQMVRAQLAVRDLKRGDPTLNSLLIVGAGVAGITAALAAARSGVQKVVVVETASEPFSLFRGVHRRHVGPFMYEWPSPFFDDQSYPGHPGTPWSDSIDAALRWRARHPCPADTLATLLTNDLARQLTELRRASRPVPTLCIGADARDIRMFVRDFALREAARASARLLKLALPDPLTFATDDLTWPEREPAQMVMQPQYVFLAAGMGQETVSLLRDVHPSKNFEGPRFWSNDQLLCAGTVDDQVLVFGGGDGALQDVLRALTGRDHPLQLLRFLEEAPAVKHALGRVSGSLLAADRQGRQFATWTRNQHEYEVLDAAVARIAASVARNRRVVRRVGQALRHGRGAVRLVVRGSHFDKAYLLNRFLVHLFIACSRPWPSSWTGRMCFEAVFGHQAVAYNALSGGHEVSIQKIPSGPTFTRTAHHIAVRYGIEQGTVPGAQMIQVSQEASAQRTSLARVELPFVV